MDNNNESIDPQVEQIKYKNILIVLIIMIFLVYKIFSNQIKFKDFLNFPSLSINYQQISGIKEYLIFFAVIIPIAYLLWKSNLKWAQEQIEIMEENEEKKNYIYLITLLR